MMNSESQVHVVLGAGQVGRLLARELLIMGHTVRLVRRGPVGEDRPGLTWMRGDILDAEFADRACRGATAIYHTANPTAYHLWDEHLPPLTAAVRGAAARSGARLIVLDNLYMVGRPDAVPFDEDTPLAPCSIKGDLRARLYLELRDAHDRGEVQVAWGRASDFFGPDAPRAAVFHPRTLAQLRAGKPVEVAGDPNQIHAYSFTPDVARGLALLGAREDAMGKVWHLPICSKGTTRELLEVMAAGLGVQLRIRRVPAWMLRAMGVFSPTIGAAMEMLYQWEGPFAPDDRRFVEAFGVEATPIREAVKATFGIESLRPGAIVPAPQDPRQARPVSVTTGVDVAG